MLDLAKLDILEMRYVILFLCAFVLFACSDDGIIIPQEGNAQGNPPDDENPDEEAVPYFTFRGFENTFSTENWIVTHTSDGVLLDYARYERGELLTFEKEPSLVTDFIAVTLFGVFPYGNNQSVEVYTTLDVKKGSEWVDPPRTFESNDEPVIGEFHITLENFPEIIGLNISNYNTLVTSGFYHGPHTVFRNRYTYEVENLPLFAANDYVISFNEDQEDFKYFFINDVADTDHITIDYNDFNFFDSYVDVPLPVGSYYMFNVTGLEEDDVDEDILGFVLENAHYSEEGYMNEYLNRNPLRIGYLDSYESFSTELTVFMNNYVYSFHRRGAKPTEINVPENIAFNTLNSSFQNFQFNFNKDYSKYIGTWETETGVLDQNYVNGEWQIEAEKDGMNQFLGELPIEIRSYYPEFYTDSLVYEKVEFLLSPEEKLTMR